MPSINDLKNDGNTKQPFVPTIEQGPSTYVDDQGNQTVTEPEELSPGIVQGESVYMSPSEIVKLKQEAMKNNNQQVKKKNNVLSMTSGKVQREKVDLNQLPKGETPGVEMHESLEKDILGPGGIFDDYVEDMKKKTIEDLEDMKAKMELEEASKEDKDEEEVTKTAEELELEELEKEYENETIDSYKNINPFADEVESSEEDMEENNIIEESIEITPDDMPVEVVEEEPVEEIVIERSTINTENIAETTLDEDEEELEESDPDAIDENEANRYVEIIRAEVSKRIKPISKKMDISGFKVASKPNMSNNIVAPKEVPIAKWALPATGITFQVKEMTGASIEKIRTAVTNNQMSTVLQIIYDNIVSEKPATMEAWAKSIAFDDFDHLFFGIYIASFVDSNYIQMTCDNDKCKDKVFVTDNIPIADMVKFKDDASEKKFKALLNSDATNPSGLIPSEIVPISENFAFGFVLPSIYAINIENGYLDNDFRTKYDSASAIAPYIDKIYYIDKENQQLIPIGYKEYPNNKAKTAKSRVIRYDKVISQLSMDEVNLIRAYILKIMENSQLLSYQIPAATCPHCGKELNATAATASQILFSRNQLSLLVNT